MKKMTVLFILLTVTSITTSSYAQTNVERAKVSGLLSACFPKALTYSSYENGDFFILDGQNKIIASGNGNISDVEHLPITCIYGAKKYTVGEAGQAGIVFHDDEHWTCNKDGHLTRYLESDTEDKTGFYTWNDAKEKCLNSTEGDHEYWFLPTIDQLGEMYVLRDKIGGFKTEGIHNFHEYWSSSVGRIYYHTASVQDFGRKGKDPAAGQFDEPQGGFDNIRVRCVRWVITTI